MIRETRWRRSIHNVVGSCENGMRVFPSFTEYESASVSIPLRGWKADRKLHSRVHFRSTSYWPRAVASKNIIKLVYPSGSSIGSRGRPFRPSDRSRLCVPFGEPSLLSLCLPSSLLSNLAIAMLPRMRPPDPSIEKRNELGRSSFNTCILLLIFHLNYLFNQRFGIRLIQRTDVKLSWKRNSVELVEP